MSPSERTQAAGGEIDDDIVEKKPSHPIETFILLVTAGALILAIVLASKELSFYVNPKVKHDTAEYKKKPLQLFVEEFEPNAGSAEAGGGGG